MIRPMKLLAVDVGNTNLTIGLFDAERLVGSWRTETQTTATADAMASTLAGLLALDGERLDTVDASAVACVVPQLLPALERALRRRTGSGPLVVEAATLEGILEIRIDRPAEAGADRLANALAVREEFGGPAIVVDLGTSTNFDVLSADGAYLGGAIAPGLGVSLAALVASASKLPPIELRRPPHAIGANTVHAMQSGTINGYIGLLSGLLAAIRGELAEQSPRAARIRVVATGGYAQHPWLGDVPGIDAVEPDLTLRGIRYAAERVAARNSARAETAARMVQ